MKLTRWLPGVERLESREVPAVTAGLSQVATWTEQGPNVIADGQTRGIAYTTGPNGVAVNNPVIGAISALVAHPTDANIMFASGVNGGVWRTDNATAAVPVWVPLTDALSTLTVADIAIDPDNPNRLVIAIGGTADGADVDGNGMVRGDLTGVYVTSNALAAPTAVTWTNISAGLANRDVKNVYIRSGVGTPGNPGYRPGYILAGTVGNTATGTTGGLYRKADTETAFVNTFEATFNNGVTYSTVPFNDNVFDLADNPNASRRGQFYMATGGATPRVWRTDDYGDKWGTVTDSQMQLSATQTVNVQLTVRDASTPTVQDHQVYVAVSNNLPTGNQATTPLVVDGVGRPLHYGWEQRNGVLSSVCWSTNQGGNWTRMDAPKQLTRALASTATNNTTTGVVTISTGLTPHRLLSGDKVLLTGNTTQLIDPGAPPTTPPTFGPNIADNMTGGTYYFVDVTSTTTFTLRNLTVTGGTGTFVGSGDPTNGFWQRVVGATPAENGEFLQLLAGQNENTVLLGGDSSQFNFYTTSGTKANPANPEGPLSFTGTFWSGNRAQSPTGKGAFEGASLQWTTLTDTGTNNGVSAGYTAPGADTRDMVYDAAGNLWVATGSGIFRRSNLGGTGNWTAASGNIRVGQFWSSSFDSLTGTIVGAMQDTGQTEQNPGSSLGWRSLLSTNDRNDLRDQESAYSTFVDNSNPAQSVRYTLGSDFRAVTRRTYDGTGALTGTSQLNFGSQATPTVAMSGITNTDLAAVGTNSSIVLQLNAIDTRRGVYGLNNVYEDSDPNGPFGAQGTGGVVENVTPPGMTGLVRAMSYGGKRAGNLYTQILFIGTSTGQLFIRGEFGVTFATSPVPGTGAVTDIEQDPDDWRHAFVLKGNRIYETTNADAGPATVWTDVSANLSTLPSATTGLPTGNGLTTQVRSIALFDPNPGTANVNQTGDVVILAGGRGGVFRRTETVCGTTTVWAKYGVGLPNTVVQDLEIKGSRLTAGTFGRGAWTVDNVVPTLTTLTTLFVTSDGAGDNIVVSADPNDQNAVLVFGNGTQLGRFSFGEFDQITINGNGGADTVQIGSLSNTLFVNYPIGAHLGGDAGDTLIVEANGSTADIRATITTTTVGNGVGDTIFSGCGSLTYSGLNSGTLEVRTGSGNDLIIVTQGTYPNVINTNTGSGNDTVVVDGGSSGTVNAVDGAGTNDTLEVYVQQGQFVFGTDSRVFAIDNLTVHLDAGFEAILLSGQGTGGTLNFAGSGLDDDFFLTTGNVAGESLLTALTPNTSTTPTRMRFTNMHTVTVNAGAGNDRMVVGASGKTAFVTYQVNANMGAGTADRVEILANGTTTPVVATITPNSVGSTAGDTLFGANGKLTYTGLDSNTEVLDLRTGFGDDRVIVSGGTYPNLIETNTGAGNDTVVLDGMMSGQVNPTDGVGTNDTVEVLVYPGQVVSGSETRVYTVGSLVFGLPEGFESLLLNGQGGGTLEFTGSGNDDDFFLTSDGTGLPGESQLIAHTPNTSTNPQRIRFINLSTVTVNAGAGNDRLIVDANGNAAGGTTKFVTYLVNAGMGGQAGDRIVINDTTTTSATRATVDPNSIASNLGTDTLFGANGRLFYSGARTLDLTTGSGADVVVFDSTTPITTNLNGGGGANRSIISGSAGNDSVNVGAPQMSTASLTVNHTNVQTYQVVGNGGTDQVNVGGSAGDETLVVNQAGSQSGDVGGLPVRLEYESTEALNLIPYSGTNSLIWHDVSSTTFGSASNPGAGVEFLPTGAASGYVRLAGGAGTYVFFDGVNGNFTMNGDPAGKNAADTLTVHGMSTGGQALYGEATSANGTDTIDANENGVSITNAAAGSLRSVSFGRTNGRVGFHTVWVRGGNESVVGDTFNSSPTSLTNLLLDGGNPSSPPGDTLNVTTNGPAVSSPSPSDGSLGPTHTRIINRGDLASLGHLNFESVTPLTVDPNNPGGPLVPSFGSTRADLFAVGTNGGTAATVNAYNLDGSLRFSLNPFGGSYGGPIKVAVGDVTGDGRSDVVVAAGPGGGPHVKVYDGQTQAEVLSFFAYDSAFTGGVTVAADDFNNDGRADIVTGTATGAPHVKVFSGLNGGILHTFFAYPSGFTNGVNVATGDVNGDGTPDIVTGTAQGSLPVVRVYDGRTLAALRDFFGYDPNFLGGVNVAAGDLNGDGRDDIVVGAGPGGGPHVKAFDGASNGELFSFFVNEPFVPGAPPTSVTGGVSVAAGDFDNDGRSDLLAGAGAGSSAIARVIKVLPGPTQFYSVNAFAGYNGGISVGA